MRGDGGSGNTLKNFKRWINALKFNRSYVARKVVPNILDRSAHKVLADAKRRCPVDTGALQASGRVEKKGRAQRDIVFGGSGTGVDYAQFVEYGTMFMAAQPYLRPAMMKAQMTMSQEAYRELNKSFIQAARMGSSR